MAHVGLFYPVHQGHRIFSLRQRGDWPAYWPQDVRLDGNFVSEADPDHGFSLGTIVAFGQPYTGSGSGIYVADPITFDGEDLVLSLVVQIASSGIDCSVFLRCEWSGDPQLQMPTAEDMLGSNQGGLINVTLTPPVSGAHVWPVTPWERSQVDW